MTTAVKDYIIIGAGPGGLQLAYFMKKNNQDFLILERSDHAGSFFSKFPRARNLISFNKRNNIYKDPDTQMKWDWNSLISEEFSPMMKDFSKKIFPSADELVAYLNHFASAHEIDIRYNTNAVRVSKTENGFKVYDQNGVTYECRMLIVAAGFTKEYTPPTIEGAELLEDSYGTVSMNEDDYEDKTVMIIGKGNSAFEVATMMLNTSSLIHLASPKSISLAWDTKYNGSVRAINTHLLDSYQLKLLHSMLDCNVDRIQKRDDGKYIVSITYAHACGEKEDLVYDKVIMSAGFQFNDQIFDEDCRPELFNDKLPRINSCWESVNVPNLFFAGTLMQFLDFRRSSSAFIGGFRHNVRSLYHVLEWRLKNVELPKKVLPIDIDVIADHMLTRLHKSAGLWHLFGHMCDILIVNKEDNSCEYINEMPLLFVQEHLSDKELLFTINYQFGDTSKNNFSLDRFPDNRLSEKSTFLHPVVNKLICGKTVATHHILEDLLGNYHPEKTSEVSLKIRSKTKKQFHEDEHVAPLKEFLRTETV